MVIMWYVHIGVLWGGNGSDFAFGMRLAIYACLENYKQELVAVITPTNILYRARSAWVIGLQLWLIKCQMSGATRQKKDDWPKD